MGTHESGVTIRLAGPPDAPALARLRYDFRTELDAPVEDESSFLDRCGGWMADRLARGGVWRCWMATAHGRPVGVSWLQLLEKLPNPVDEPELHGYVSSLYVKPDFRGSGIGSSLLRACLQECESVDADAVFLWPTPRSRPLYERHGFQVRDDMLELRIRRRAAGSRR